MQLCLVEALAMLLDFRQPLGERAHTSIDLACGAIRLGKQPAKIGQQHPGPGASESLQSLLYLHHAFCGLTLVSQRPTAPDEACCQPLRKAVLGTEVLKSRGQLHDALRLPAQLLKPGRKRERKDPTEGVCEVLRQGQGCGGRRQGAFRIP